MNDYESHWLISINLFLCYSQVFLLINKDWSSLVSSWKMVVLCPIITFKRNLPCTWCSAFVVVPRNARRRTTPLPKRTSISTRKSSWLFWNTTRYEISINIPHFSYSNYFFPTGWWEWQDQQTPPRMPWWEMRSWCFHGRSQGSSILWQVCQDVRFQCARVRWVSINKILVRRCEVENTLWLCIKTTF